MQNCIKLGVFQLGRGSNQSVWEYHKLGNPKERVHNSCLLRATVIFKFSLYHFQLMTAWFWASWNPSIVWMFNRSQRLFFICLQNNGDQQAGHYVQVSFFSTNLTAFLIRMQFILRFFFCFLAPCQVTFSWRHRYFLMLISLLYVIYSGFSKIASIFDNVMLVFLFSSTNFLVSF
jgi:hypothetical protein